MVSVGSSGNERRRCVRYSRLCGLFSVSLVLSLATVRLSAQTGFVPANPITPPSVSPPVMAPMPTVEMPQVTAPEVSATSDSSTAGKSADGKSTTRSVTKSGSAAATGKTAAATESSPAGTASALSMLGLGSDSPLLKALSGGESDDSSVNALSGLLGTSSSSTDSATLKKILALVEKQQAQSADSSGTAKTSAVNPVAASTSAAAALPEKPLVTSGGELIRFTVNGYNLAATTKTLVSSILAKDGSFLLTGDRRYVSSNELRTETFYLLCRKNSDGTYRLHADVTQDSKNAYSYLYRLARLGPLKGSLTGDLLVFRTADADFRLDLVIRVVSPTGNAISGR